MHRTDDFSFINKTNFTSFNVPLQLTTNEEIIYFNPRTSFYLQIGNGIPFETRIYNCYRGFLFLTNYRLIYRCKDSEAGFESFCLPVIDVIGMENNHVQFSYDGFLRDVIFDFHNSISTVFFTQLKKAVKNIERVIRRQDKRISENKEGLPYYSDVV